MKKTIILLLLFVLPGCTDQRPEGVPGQALSKETGFMKDYPNEDWYYDDRGGAHLNAGWIGPPVHGTNSRFYPDNRFEISVVRLQGKRRAHPVRRSDLLPKILTTKP